MSYPEGPERQREHTLDSKTFEQARTCVHKPFESYRAIREELAQSGALPEAVCAVKRQYAEDLSEATFLTESDWEMLATLWLHDEETAVHSVDTYRIARDRIREPLRLTDPPIEIDLSKAFSREGVSEEQFLRACLLHDIGKLAMPIEVLTNHITDTECADILFSHYESLGAHIREVLRYPEGEPLPASPGTLLFILRVAHIRPQGLVPVRLLLASDDERLAASGELAQLGLSLDDSLLAIMQTHDKYSRSILSETGLPLEADLAGAHHRHEKDYSPTRHSLTVGVEEVSVDLSDIIHLSDVTQAMRSRRHYKRPESSPAVLAELVSHANYDMVDPFITYLWITDRLERQTDPIDPADEKHYQVIRMFLDKNKEMYHEDLKKYQLANGSTQ